MSMLDHREPNKLLKCNLSRTLAAMTLMSRNSLKLLSQKLGDFLPCTNNWNRLFLLDVTPGQQACGHLNLCSAGFLGWSWQCGCARDCPPREPCRGLSWGVASSMWCKFYTTAFTVTMGLLSFYSLSYKPSPLNVDAQLSPPLEIKINQRVGR